MFKKTIRGRLDFNNVAATPNEKNEFYFAYTDNRILDEAINPETKFHHDGIVFNSSPFVTMVSNGRQDAIAFIDALKEAVKSESAKVLGLYGNFEIILETGYLPIIFKIEVKDEQVIYQEVEYVWTEPAVA